MPRKRFDNLNPKTRTLLLSVALKEFAAKGFSGASLNRILARAGISKGAYYYYFQDKDDLFVTTLENGLQDLVQRVAVPDFGHLTAKTFWPALAKAAAQWQAQFSPSRDLLRAARSFDLSRLQEKRFAKLLAKGRAFWRMSIEAGQRLHCVRTDLAVDALVRLVEASDHALDAAFFAKGKTTRRALAAHTALVFDTLKRLLIHHRLLAHHKGERR